MLPVALCSGHCNDLVEQVKAKFRAEVTKLEEAQADQKNIDEAHMKECSHTQLVVQEAAKGIKELEGLVKEMKTLAVFAENHLHRLALQKAAEGIRTVSADDARQDVFEALATFNKAWAKMRACLDKDDMGTLVDSCENAISVVVAFLGAADITKQDLDAINESCDTWKRVFEAHAVGAGRFRLVARKSALETTQELARGFLGNVAGDPLRFWNLRRNETTRSAAERTRNAGQTSLVLCRF